MCDLHLSQLQTQIHVLFLDRDRRNALHPLYRADHHRKKMANSFSHSKHADFTPILRVKMAVCQVFLGDFSCSVQISETIHPSVHVFSIPALSQSGSGGTGDQASIFLAAGKKTILQNSCQSTTVLSHCAAGCCTNEIKSNPAEGLCMWN